MPYDTLTLHGVVMSKTEMLPTEEGEHAVARVKIAVSGYKQQPVTTVPLETVGSASGPDRSVEAEVPYGYGYGSANSGSSSERVALGFEPPTTMSETIVTVQTSDLNLLEVLKIGKRVDVKFNGEEYKLATNLDGDPLAGFSRWRVVKPKTKKLLKVKMKIKT